MDASSAYVGRVNKAIDYIFDNLDGSLKLEEVAKAANFSPFHFHRIFRSAIGETLHQFTKRVRLERALHLMSHNPQHTLTEVALKCGFASSSDFSRSFKQKFGVPPRAFDLGAFRRNQRDEFERLLTPENERNLLAGLPPGENPDGFTVTIKKLPARYIAYKRVLRPFEPDRVTDACHWLMDWADTHGVGSGQWLGYMWEDPELVPVEQCRYDVGVEVDGHFWTDEAVGCLQLPEMTVAEIPIKGSIEVEQRAIDWMYRTWLPASGYAPDDQPAFEAWDGRPFAHGTTHFELHMQLPIVSANQPL